MTNGATLLIAAGETCGEERFQNSLNSATHIIAVDGGVRHLRALDKAPTLVVGDFDSANEEDLQWATENGAGIVHLSSQEESDPDNLSPEEFFETQNRRQLKPAPRL